MYSLTIVLLLSSILAIGQCSQIKAAPYFMPMDNNPPDIAEAIKSSGLKHFILAFIVAPDSGGCVPTWDGLSDQKVSEDTKVLAKVNAIRAAGGDISISFGGYTGIELGHAKACSDVKSLTDAYQYVIDKYSLTNIDLDIEGDDLGDVPAENNRFQAVKALKEKAKASGKELFVSLTLPATTVGLSDLSRDEIRRAVTDGAVIDLYKVMAFDYAGPGADMTNSVISIMELAHKQIKELRTDLNDEQVYAATGLIAMNGHTDQPSELFSLDTFRKLVEYANTKRLGRFSFWALNRDRPCSAGTTGWVSGVCSSVSQQPYEYSRIIAEFDPTKVTTKPIVTTVTVKVTDKPTSSPNQESTTVAPTKTTATPTPEPVITEVDCTHVPTGTLFPYKEDCHRYIRCYDKKAHLTVCAEGTIYDTKLHLCNWPQAVDRPECH